MQHRTDASIVRIVAGFILVGAFTMLSGHAAAQRANNPGQPFEQLEAKLDELESKTDTVDAKLDALESKADALEGKADTIDGTVTATSGKIDTLQSTADGIDTAVGVLEGKADQLGTTADTIDGKVDALGAKADAIQAAVGALPAPADISQLQTGVDAIETKLDALAIPTSTDISGLQTAVDTLESKTDSLESKLDAMETKLDELAAAVTSLATGSPANTQCLSGQRFIDKGLTIFDCKENLEWEKKTTSNVGDTFTWSTAIRPTEWVLDGTVVDYIDALNTPPSDTEPCFAERCDWRLATREELLTIADCSFSPSPCINPIFGPTDHGTGPPPSAAYWTSTPVPANPNLVYAVQFRAGLPFDASGKASGAQVTDSWLVRAVRSGP